MAASNGFFWAILGQRCTFFHPIGAILARFPPAWPGSWSCPRGHYGPNSGQKWHFSKSILEPSGWLNHTCLSRFGSVWTHFDPSSAILACLSRVCPRLWAEWVKMGPKMVKNHSWGGTDVAPFGGDLLGHLYPIFAHLEPQQPPHTPLPSVWSTTGSKRVPKGGWGLRWALERHPSPHK